jgi:hypothetical protein
MKRIICTAACLLMINCVLIVQGAFRIASGTNIVTGSGINIIFSNTDFINNESFQQTSGDGTVRFSGNSDAAISGTNLPVFDKLVVAKTGTAVLKLQRTINIVSEVGFESGKIDLNGNNIVLLSPGILNGESETSHITGSFGGYYVQST